MCRLPRCAPALAYGFAVALSAAEPPGPSTSAATPDAASPPARASGTPTQHPILIVAPRPRPTPFETPAARPRLISPETAARLAAVAPKFDPARAPSTQSEGPLPLDEGVLSLERYIVEGERPPNIKERQFLTPETKVKLGYKRNPGLKIGSLPFLNNDAVARDMLEEDLELERRREMGDLHSLLPTQAKVRTRKPAKSWAETGGSWAERKR